MESINAQDVPACLLCGSRGVLLYKDLRDRLFRVPGTWTLLKCPICRFVWLNPRPVPADIGKLYDVYCTHATTRPSFAGLRRIVLKPVLAARLGYHGLTKSPLQTWIGRVLSWVGPIREIVELNVMTLEGPPKGTLLDVGCGNGAFLARMRELGWEVVGVEPDGQAVKVAREHFGLDIYEHTLEEAGFRDGAFDAITMNHVIEHVWDPIGILHECRRVLKPGGTLVVVTPNVESLVHRLFREASFHLDPPRHLYLFSRRTLMACAEQAGLNVMNVRTTAGRAHSTWAASRLIRRNGTLPGASLERQGLRLQLEALAFQAVEHALCHVMDAGEEVILIATK